VVRAAAVSHRAAHHSFLVGIVRPMLQLDAPCAHRGAPHLAQGVSGGNCYSAPSPHAFLVNSGLHQTQPCEEVLALTLQEARVLETASGMCACRQRCHTATAAWQPQVWACWQTAGQSSRFKRSNAG
jgi:hypothetical protein